MLITTLPAEDKLALAVAFLRAQRLTGGEIAEILTRNGHKVDQPKVAQLKQRAEKSGWLVTQVTEFLFAPALLQEIRVMATHQQHVEGAASKLSATKTQLQVFYSGSEGISPEAWQERLDHFSSVSAARVDNLLSEGSMVGLSWGHTTESMVAALERRPLPKRITSPSRDILFVPTSGEPLGPGTRSERSPTALTARLNTRYHLKQKPLSLAGVTAVIPREFATKNKRRIIERYISGISDYKTIFGPVSTGKPLVDKIDTILTSVGSLSQQWHMYQSEWMQAGGVTIAELKSLAIGDIGGTLIARGDLTPRQHKKFRAIADSWTGIKLATFKRVAKDALKAGKPGVIVIAIGANKAEAVLATLKLGVANHVLVDHDLASALARLIHG